jgi:hypothetical protein
MNQLEIQFFWPLTEQIPLELDYSNCEKPKVYTNTGTIIGTNGSYVFLTTGTTSTYALHVDGKVSMDADKMTFRTSKKPNIIRRALFNVMGIKLENSV